MATTLSTHTLVRLTQLRLEGKSLPQIAHIMQKEGYRTRHGGKWFPSTIRQYCEQIERRLPDMFQESFRQRAQVKGRQVAKFKMTAKKAA